MCIIQTLTCGPFSNLDVNRSIMLDVWILGPEYWPPGSNLDGPRSCTALVNITNNDCLNNILFFQLMFIISKEFQDHNIPSI